MSLREFILENFAGDLEYHPRRAVLYLLLGVGSASLWIFTPYASKLTAVPLVFLLGSLTLVTKGIFLLRRSSEGFGLSQESLSGASPTIPRKDLPSIPVQAAQVFQDFGAGPLFLWPLWPLLKMSNEIGSTPPLFTVFLTGAGIFVAGWAVRRFLAHER